MRTDPPKKSALYMFTCIETTVIAKTIAQLLGYCSYMYECFEWIHGQLCLIHKKFSCRVCVTLIVTDAFLSQILESKDANILKAIQDGIDRVNKKSTSNAQKIQKWSILPRDFSIPGGELGRHRRNFFSLKIAKYQLC